MENILSCFKILQKYLKVGLLRSKCYVKYFLSDVITKKTMRMEFKLSIILKKRKLGGGGYLLHFCFVSSLLHINFMLLGVKMSRAFIKIFSIPFWKPMSLLYFLKCQGTEWLCMNGVLCTHSWLQTYCFYVFVYFEPHNLK